MGIDPNAFRDFEHHGWQEVATRYHGSFAAITVQSIEPLLDAAGAARGGRLLDVATGPGYAAGAAARRGAIVVGVDFASEMVEEARRRFPSVEFQEGDAENLSFPDQSFDAVVMNFGMLHLARPEKAMSEAYRVLRPQGRFAFTVWDTPDEAIGFGIVLNAIRKYGDMDVPIPPGPPFFRFSDPAESTRALNDAGFINVTITRVPQVWRFDSPDFVYYTMTNAAVRNAALLRGQKEETRKAIEEEIRRQVEKYRTAGGFELPMPSVLSAATKPAGSSVLSRK
jgi:ubiquinone/menaquinone biosynthesis C-methylase UbiE